MNDVQVLLDTERFYTEVPPGSVIVGLDGCMWSSSETTTTSIDLP